MKIGIITNTTKYVVDRLDYAGCELFNFSISPDVISYSNLFDSAFATPARYIMEMWKRLIVADAKECRDDSFIFNPLFEMDPQIVRGVLNELSSFPYGDKFVLISDCDNTPIGYLFPATLLEDESKFLSLLSTVDSSLDRRYLDSVFLTSSLEIVLSTVSLRGRGLNNFSFTPDQVDIYRWTTENAIDVLTTSFGSVKTATNSGKDEGTLKKELRNKIPFAAIMPYQAGDALFFAIAATHAGTHFTRIVIHALFKDIISENLASFEQVVLSSPLLQKEGRKVGDDEYLNEAVRNLPAGSFYYYCRPSRCWFKTSFHLIDKFAFALGKSFLSNDELLSKNLPKPALYRPAVRSQEYHILLHFDAGWPLKVYPKSWQEKLIDLLYGKGFSITVLATEEKEEQRFKSVTFKGLSQFKELLASNHLLIGMDSFPVNYAVHVVGLPTICLYSSTNPAVSRAEVAANYLYLTRNLSCNPCDGFDVCPQHNREFCANFVEPEEVFAKLLAMLKEVYQ